MKRVDALRSLMGDDDIGELTIKIFGTYFPVGHWLRIYDYLNEDILVSKADLCEPKDEQQKPKVDARGKKRMEIDMGKVHALHNAGWSYEKIADEMGCSAGTISMRLKEERDEDNAQRDICHVC